MSQTTMVSVHQDNPISGRESWGDPSDGRLNLLLSAGGWQAETWAEHLPRLLAPMGVQAWRVRTGAEATDLIQRGPRMHLAVVDLTLPLDQDSDIAKSPAEGGTRLLHLLERLPHTPPTVVIKRRTSARDDARLLAEALRRGAFAVVDRPVEMELMLEVFRRALRRFYADRWPSGESDAPRAPKPNDPPRTI